MAQFVIILGFTAKILLQPTNMLISQIKGTSVFAELSQALKQALPVNQPNFNFIYVWDPLE